MSLIQSARLNGHDPYRYLRDVLERLPIQRASRIEELLPHCWKPAEMCLAKAGARSGSSGMTSPDADGRVRLDGEEPLLELDSLMLHPPVVLPVPRRYGQVVLECKGCPSGLVRAQIRLDLAQDPQRLTAGHLPRITLRVLFGVSALTRDAACRERYAYVLEQSTVGVADGHHQTALLVAMQSRERDGALAVNQACDLGGIGDVERGRALHAVRSYRRKPRRSPGGASNWWRRRDGCSTSFEAGRTMPSSCCQDAGRVIDGRAARRS
jgi:hypothetical protein